ncbi:MAG: DUF3159 domain-containing protein [Propionibacteriales bacterium]|nr:DUF3159 domain-containing protein [Propionibacteriales bacterium]
MSTGDDTDRHGQATASGVTVDTVEALVRRRLSEALGGRRGMLEAALPTLCFTISWILSSDLRISLTLGIGAAVLALLARIVQRSNPQFVLNAFIVIAIGAVFAMRSGRAEDAFLPGLIYNAVYFVVLALSVLARWPMIGLMIGAVTGDLTSWRRDRQMVRLCSILTWFLAIPCLLRVVAQYPLWAAGEAALLGFTKVAMGWPLQIAAFAAMAWVLARNHTPVGAEQTAGSGRPA